LNSSIFEGLSVTLAVSFFIMQFPYTYGIAFSSLENAAATNIFAKS
jgi:hypothetical protein